METIKRSVDWQLKHLNTEPEEKGYSVIGSFTPDESVGKCVYCKHCHPFKVCQMERMQKIKKYFTSL